MTMLEAQEEAEAWEAVERERVEKDAEIARLRAALKPFADLASIYVRRAETFGHKDDAGVFGATDLEMDRTITVGDLRAALKAMEGE